MVFVNILVLFLFSKKNSNQFVGRVEIHHCHIHIMSLNFLPKFSFPCAKPMFHIHWFTIRFGKRKMLPFFFHLSFSLRFVFLAFDRTLLKYFSSIAFQILLHELCYFFAIYSFCSCSLAVFSSLFSLTLSTLCKCNNK